MWNFSIAITLLLTSFLIALAFSPFAAQQPTQMQTLRARLEMKEATN